MEQQGAVARQAAIANAEDESSQAEGTVEGAVGYSRPTQDNNPHQHNNTNNPHYENIYESIEQYAANDAIAPADNNLPAAPNINFQHPPQQVPAQPTNQQAQNNRPNALNVGYRNDLYDRTNNSAYDVPRSVRSGLGMRRSNLQLDLGANRMRYNGLSNSSNYGSHRQRSLDDTESHHYYNLNCNNTGYGSTRYENIYEQIRDEPIYRNISGGTARVYGRLDVIGHGIGRIERHLSSSCGNIDHYNLGGHYAVLGHSHFGTVGHIRLNTSNTNGSSQPKENGVKSSSSSFFSCLGGENSQSMNNIYRATGGNSSSSNSFQNTNSSRGTSSSGLNSSSTSSSRCTGAIPKSKSSKTQSNASCQNKSKSSPEHTSTLNRISKSSLQWLLVNKWLPLWIGQGPDCKIIDFNFMFSRNCDSCDHSSAPQQDLVRFNGRAEMHEKRDPTGRPLRSTLSRLRESECPSLRREENNYENVHVQFHNGFEFGRSRDNYDRPSLLRARSESPNFTHRVCKQQNSCSSQYSDPFKNYELNAENNTFKPRNVSTARRKVYGSGATKKTEPKSSDEPSPGPSGLRNSYRKQDSTNKECTHTDSANTESCDDEVKTDAAEDDENILSEPNNDFSNETDSNDLNDDN